MSSPSTDVLDVALYAQHCVMAGQWDRSADPEADRDTGDHVWYTGTREALLAEAADLESRGKRETRAGYDLYLMRCARSLREAVR